MMNHSIYILFGSEEYAGNFLKENFPPENTAIYHHDFLSIDDARNLRYLLSQHMGQKNVFFIRIEKILGEAQNALLKICEEFSSGTLIFSFSASVQLLDTFLSRGEIYREGSHTDTSLAKIFLRNDFLTRMKMFDGYIKENKTADPRSYIRNLVESLIEYEKGNSVFSTNVYNNKSTYLDVIKLLEFQKSSPKQIFEYLAVTAQK